jgi:glycosyltransferase involved in cell wall biosynthesis
MDVFLMPSNYESFGFMALEAMACGVPPVVFAGTTMQEILGDGAGGYVLPERSAEALAEALRHAFDDEDGRVGRAEAARSRAVTTYALDRYVDAMLALYRQLKPSRAA